MYSLSLERIWSKPRCKEQCQTAQSSYIFLQRTLGFPIHELHACDFKCSWLEIQGIVPNLKLLHLDSHLYNSSSPEDTQLPFMKIPVVLYTKAFKLSQAKHLDQLFEIIGSINVKEMIIDHYSYSHDNIIWSLEKLKMFSNKVHISHELHPNYGIKLGRGN